MLANHIAEREQQLIELAYNSVRKRVATALVNLCEQSGPNLHFLREDLAALAGTAKETLIRTLTDFKNEHLIEIHDGTISILKPEKLKGMPN
jgi:CRP-like cAMP-binding protein